MSMAAALSNVFSLDRQRARYTSERVVENDNEEAAEQGGVVSDPSRRTSEEENNNNNNSNEEPDIEEGREETTGDETDDENTSNTNNEEAADDDGFPLFSGRTTMTLAELEEERELARRRSSACILLAAFILFRFWIWALQEGDYGLILLCLVGTSWTARWISHNREREEELDRRIANYLESSEPGTTEVDRNDLRMLSFQAQLALAIMESQRQMMQGGFGHPDGENESQGVSEEARSHWERFKYRAESPPGKPATKGGYGSVSQKSDTKDSLTDEAPHCSICLSEYEEGEDITKLPCKHMYHDECISSWTENHVKCPLCNFDLGSVSGEPSSSSPSDDSVV